MAFRSLTEGMDATTASGEPLFHVFGVLAQYERALFQEHVVAEVGGKVEQMIERLEARCHELAIEPPTSDRAERIARTALHVHEERFHAGVYAQLSHDTHERLNALLRPDKAGGDGATQGDAVGNAPAVLLKLRGSPEKCRPRRPAHAGIRRAWSARQRIAPRGTRPVKWIPQRSVLISGKETGLTIVAALDQVEWHTSEGDAGPPRHIGIILDQKRALNLSRKPWSVPTRPTKVLQRRLDFL